MTGTGLNATRKRRIKNEPDLCAPQPSLRNSSIPAKKPAKKRKVASDDEGDEEDAEEDNEEESEEESEEDNEELDAIGEKVKFMVDGMNQKYDSSTEPLPDLPAYHPAFESIERYRSEIMTEAIDILKSSIYKDAETAQLLGHALTLQEINYPRDRRVALIGDSGTGVCSYNLIVRASFKSNLP